MMGYTPIFGPQVRFVLLGGVEISGETLLRWYVLHVLMLPFVIVIFMAIHFWRVRKDGGISGPLLTPRLLRSRRWGASRFETLGLASLDQSLLLRTTSTSCQTPLICSFG
jgi:hypothetical protein